MLLKIGVPDYPFRCMSETIGSARIVGRKAGRDLPLIVVSADEMEDRHKKLPNVRGLPTRIAFSFKKQRVVMHPNPDGEYTLEIDPPRKAGQNTLSLPGKEKAIL